MAVEAGLGGRYDATNVLAAPVVLCTSVGLDHTAQLGPTREAIAGEKLAVVHPGARVVCGEADAEIAPVLERLAREHGAVEVLLLPPGADVPDAPPLASPGAFQRANLAVALAGCERLPGVALDRRRALQAAAAVRVPGRLETVGTAPLTVLDGAHNPHAAAALAAELPALLGERRPRVLVVAILADKDADGVLRELAPHVDACVATQTGSPRARPAAELAARAEAVGLVAVVEPRSGVGTGPGAGRRGPGRRRARDRLAVAAGRPRRGGRDEGWCTMARVSGRLGVLTFAVAIILIVVAVSYAAGYVLGKMVL